MAAVPSRRLAQLALPRSVPCRSVQADKVSLQYESLGNPAGPTILLVMGLGMQMIMWPDEFCEMLVRKGFRVVRFDNRDVGLSTQLDHLGTPNIGLATLKFLLRLPVKAPYLIDDMARDTAALMDALGIRARARGRRVHGRDDRAEPRRERAGEGGEPHVDHVHDRQAQPPAPTSRARRALLRAPAKPGDIEGATRR